MAASKVMAAKREPIPSLKTARTPWLVRILARLVLFSLVFLPFALIFIPWQQTVHGDGRAIAFNPVERPQFVVAPIQGRVEKWHVVEGQKVMAGQLMVQMLDIDPLLPQRLEDESQALSTQMTLALGGVSEVQRRITNLELSQSFQLATQDAIIRSDELVVEERENGVLDRTTERNRADGEYRRLDAANKGGEAIVPKQQVDNARAAYERAVATVKQADAQLSAAKERLAASRELRSRIVADTVAAISGEKIALQRAEQEVQAIRRSQLSLQNRIARQRQQNIPAPADGTIFRILANGEAGGQIVNVGERLATLVPDVKPVTERHKATLLQIASTMGLTASSPIAGPAGIPQIAATLAPEQVPLALIRGEYPAIVCELYIDGNDLPLVRTGDLVRLQFEGWPAVQFVAFPETTAGTFGGRVYLVDPNAANERGQFRILVEPDPNDRPWPDQELLRQGMRAQGWVLLQRVRLGWELWRTLNGFPPIREVKSKSGGTVLGPVQRK